MTVRCWQAILKTENEGMNDLFDLTGKVAIVTGSGRGLGRAMALELVRCGATVVVAGRSPEGLVETADMIRAEGGTAATIQFDAEESVQCHSLVAQAVEKFGRLDGMVINHAVSPWSPAIEVKPAELQEVLSVNLMGAFFCAQAAASQMIKQQSGSIVLISSNCSLIAIENLSAYSVSKAGVDQLARSLCAEWGRYNVRINTINPGWTAHRMKASEHKPVDAEVERQIKKSTPMGRRGTLREIGGPVAFLVSDASGFISGETITVDGGWCAL